MGARAGGVSLGLLLAILVVVSPLWADPIGYAAAYGWAGTGSVIASGATLLDSQFDSATNAVVAAEAESLGYYGRSLTGPYSFEGYLTAEGNLGNAIRAGGYFRDELYVQSANGLPVDIELQFSVSAELWAGPGGQASLSATWLYPDLCSSPPCGSSAVLDFKEIAKVTDSSHLQLTNQLVSLWSSANGYSLTSGTYLPVSLTLYGYVENSEIDWFGTAELTGVNVYQNGVLLGASDYTILNANGTAAFEPFETPVPVPEPMSLLLLGTGLVALRACRRARR